jgi:hypothetical protein
MKSRMATIYNLPAFLKSEHTLLGELASALKAPRADLLLPKLKRIEEHLQKILDSNTPLQGGAKQMGQLFKDLSHYYTERNPIKSLGYKVMADELFLRAQ